MRQDAEAICRRALDEVRPQGLVSAALTDSDRQRLSLARRIIVVGAGKAGAAMSEGLEQCLGDLLSKVEGLVSVPAPGARALKRIRLLPGRPAGRNEPGPDTLQATDELVDLVQSAGPDDVAICLISGGGSALLEKPVEGISLEQLQGLAADLQAHGASIAEMNVVRKHLSQVKGGRLAATFHGRWLLSLILSDVMGDELDVVASGPTVPDPSTFRDALDIVTRYALADRHIECQAVLEAGRAGLLTETPKKSALNIVNRLIGNNGMALAAAEAMAKDLGYRTLNRGTVVQGETSSAAQNEADLLLELARDLRQPVCLVSGGETTVTMTGPHGTGGRNQEYVLAAMVHLGSERMQDVVIASLATDGEDGPTDAAGAMADRDTVSRAQELDLDADGMLARHDAYYFFEATSGLIKTGLTETNVMDVHIGLSRPGINRSLPIKMA
jgi:hydroxypyruvate reductase/glycerate 2-kinase